MVYIYVLRLEEEKWYVGRSETPLKRIEEHFTASGGRKKGGYHARKWIRVYKPIRLRRIYANCDPYDEDKITLRYMSKYGIANVRGGSFSSMKLDIHTINLINRMIDGATGRCFRCHRKGHFAGSCR